MRGSMASQIEDDQMNHVRACIGTLCEEMYQRLERKCVQRDNFVKNVTALN